MDYALEPVQDDPFKNLPEMTAPIEDRRNAGPIDEIGSMIKSFALEPVDHDPFPKVAPENEKLSNDLGAPEVYNSVIRHRMEMDQTALDAMRGNEPKPQKFTADGSDIPPASRETENNWGTWMDGAKSRKEIDDAFKEMNKPGRAGSNVVIDRHGLSSPGAMDYMKNPPPDVDMFLDNRGNLHIQPKPEDKTPTS